MRVVGMALMAAGLMTGTAQAQAIYRPMPPGVVIASDIDGPYGDVGPPIAPRYAPSPYPPRVYGPPPGYGPPPYGPSAYAPPVLPIQEIYRIVRDGGYSPLGAPQQRGAVYTIAVIDLGGGEDGRLVIDARSGRIVRFMPAYRYGARSGGDVNEAYAPTSDLPRIATAHPPATVPQARGPVPLPKPRTASAAPPAVPSAPTAALAAAQPALTRPAVTLQPTQAMPAAQGVE